MAEKSIEIDPTLEAGYLALRQVPANRDQELAPEGQRKTAEAGSIALSLFVGGVMVYQTHDPMLGFAFAFILGFLLTNRLTRALRR